MADSTSSEGGGSDAGEIQLPMWLMNESNGAKLVKHVVFA